MSERKHILMGECKFTDKINHEQHDLSDAKFIDEDGNVTTPADWHDWNEALRGEATMTIGQAIKEERLRQGLSLEALERISGVNYKTIGKWERGKNVPDLLCLIDVCDALEVSIDEILGRNHIKQQFAKEMLTEIDKQIKTHDGVIGLRNLKTYIYRYYEV